MRFQIFKSNSRYEVFDHYTIQVLYTASTREEAAAFLRGVLCGMTLKQ